MDTHVDALLTLYRYTRGQGTLPRQLAPSHPSQSLTPEQLVVTTLLTSALADQLLIPRAP